VLCRQPLPHPSTYTLPAPAPTTCPACRRDDVTYAGMLDEIWAPHSAVRAGERLPAACAPAGCACYAHCYVSLRRTAAAWATAGTHLLTVGGRQRGDARGGFPACWLSAQCAHLASLLVLFAGLAVAFSVLERQGGLAAGAAATLSGMPAALCAQLALRRRVELALPRRDGRAANGGGRRRTG